MTVKMKISEIHREINKRRAERQQGPVSKEELLETLSLLQVQGKILIEGDKVWKAN